MTMRNNLFAAALLAAALFVECTLPANAATEAPQYDAGESWNYRAVNAYNGLPHGSFTQSVAGAAAGVVAGAAGGEIRINLRSDDGKYTDTVTFSRAGQMASGMLNDRAGGPLEPALQMTPFPLEEGQRWKQSVTRADPVQKQNRTVTIYGKVQGWEQVKVPAGEFRALKIVREIFLGDHDAFRGQTKLTEYEWYVPELKHWAKLQNFEEYHMAGDNAAGSYYQGERLILELMSYQPGKR
jgi:hypothetical protein